MKKTKYLLFLLMLLTFFVSNTKEAEATKGYPHPVYQDEWDYGVSGNHGHSYYYLMAPVRLGSASAVKNLYGVGVHESTGQKFPIGTRTITEMFVNYSCSYFFF